MNRILIVARDYNAAQHYAKDQKLSPGRWVYVSSYHNVQGNAGMNYIKIPGYDLRPDIEIIETELKKQNCPPVLDPHQIGS